MKNLFILLIPMLLIACESKPKMESSLHVTDTKNITDSISTNDTFLDSTKLQTQIFPALEKSKYENDVYANIGDEIMKTETIGGIMIGQEKHEVLMILGKPSNIEKEVLWDVDGMHHSFWNYIELGLRVEFIRSEGKTSERVAVIELSSNQLSTSKSVSIGTHKNIVLTKYLNEISVEGNEIKSDYILIGDGGYGGIKFSFENDTISNIYLGPLIRC